MKNKVFEVINNIYIFLYRLINGAVYFIFSLQRSKYSQTISITEKKEIKAYWSKYKRIKWFVNEFRWFKSKGIYNVKMIPESIWHSDVEPHFNNVFLEKAFQDKNYYELLIGKNNCPATLIRCINGQLLDSNFLPVNDVKAVDLIKQESEVIVKPSIESGGGKSILFLDNTITVADFNDLFLRYKNNFLIQKILIQHPFLSIFNSSSLNTMRLITFLYKGEVRQVYGELRFGSSGSRLDNSASGGSWIILDKNGWLDSKALKFDKSKKDIIVDHDFKFPCLLPSRIPNWDSVVGLIKTNHYKLSHFGIVYWDVALSDDGNPIIVEYNLLDSDAYAYQFAIGPFFGDITDEVLDEVYGR